MNPFERISMLEKHVAEMDKEIQILREQTRQTLETQMNALTAQGEMLSGLAERVQELEVPKFPRTHFSTMRPPEVKTR